MFRRVIVFAALCAASVAYGQSKPMAPTNLANITVTAPTGTANFLDNSLAPVIVIGAPQLDAFQGTGIASLLQFYAGLDVARNGGPGQPTSLFLRGAGSTETMVLVDGIKVNSGAIGGAPLANIRTSSVGRIEIVQAPRSALYGSSAIGGVIDIVLKQPPRQGFSWGARVGSGHYSSRSASIHVGAGNGSVFGDASLSWFQTSGFPPLLDSSNASGYRNQSIHVMVGTRDSDGESYATFWRSQGTSDYLSFLGSPLSEDYTDRVTSIHLLKSLSPSWSSRIVLGQFFDGIDQVQSPDFTRSWRNSINWRNDVLVGPYQLFTFGLYYAHDHVGALSYGTGYDSVTRTEAVYGEDQVTFGRQQALLAVRDSYFSSFGHQLTWNINYGYRFLPDWQVTAGAGTGFRAPTATDRYGYGGNPELQPEYSHSLNVSVNRTFTSLALLRLDLYRNRIADLITYEASSTGGQEQNIGLATITGANLSLRLHYGHWSVIPGINVQRPIDNQTGGYLPRRSRRSATVDLSYRVPGEWRLGLNLLVTGQRKDSNFNNQVDAGYVLTDLSGGLRITRGLWINARLENVFNVSYQTAAGYRSPGRGLYLSLSYNYI